MQDSTEPDVPGRVLSDEEIEEEFKKEVRKDYHDYPGGQGAIFWPFVVAMLLFLGTMLYKVLKGELPS